MSFNSFICKLLAQYNCLSLIYDSNIAHLLVVSKNKNIKISEVQPRKHKRLDLLRLVGFKK